MNTKTKFPSLSRRPSGFTQELERAVLSALAASNVSAAGLAALLSNDAKHPDYAAAESWASRFPATPPAAAWWALARVELAAAQKSELADDMSQELDTCDVSAACERLRERYVYAAFRDEIWDRRAKAWLSTRAVDTLEAHAMPLDEKGRRLSAFSLLRTDPRAARVHNERYMPGVDSELVEREGVKWLNSWQKSEVEPVSGDAMPMLQHILYLCNGNRDHARHLTDFLAFCVQNPGKKIAHAPLIISYEQGVGKDTLAIAMSRIVGLTNFVSIDDGAIEDGRNEFLLRAQLVIVPEIMTGDRKDIANKLKPLITQEIIRVNEKNVKPYFVENQANFMFFSNHENAAHIETSDRRYFVIICKSKPKSDAYYDALYDYIRSADIAGFAWFLKNRDISAFNPAARPPETEDKSTVQRACRGSVESWLDDAYESRASGLRNDVVNLRDAVSDMQSNGAPRMSVQQLASFLKSRGGVDLGPVRLPGRGQTRIWVIRNAADAATLRPDQLEIALTGGAKIPAMSKAGRVVASRSNVVEMPAAAAE